jgi:hypothetical protein
MGEARSVQFGVLPWLAERAAVVVAGLDVPLRLVVPACLPEGLDDLLRPAALAVQSEEFLDPLLPVALVFLPEALDNLHCQAALAVQLEEFLDPLPPVALVFLLEASAEARVRGNRQLVYRWECCD